MTLYLVIYRKDKYEDPPYVYTGFTDVKLALEYVEKDYPATLPMEELIKELESGPIWLAINYSTWEIVPIAIMATNKTVFSINVI